jgi:hypothetical protein
VEKPASRLEILALESEFETKLAIVDSFATAEAPVMDLDLRDLHEPLKDSVMLLRARLLTKLDTTDDEVFREKWVLLKVQSELHASVCEEMAAKLCAMMSVTSSELGNSMRRLKQAYSSCLEEMRQSWAEMKRLHVDNEQELSVLRSRLNNYSDDIRERETLIRRRMESKMHEMERQFLSEQDKDAQKLRDAEAQVAATGESLKALNGIFKTMQQDEGVIKVADLQLKCTRFENELGGLSAQLAQLDKVKESLEKETLKSKALESELRQKAIELSSLRGEMGRRDATIATLMEKDALINAEMLSLRHLTDNKASDQRVVAEADLETPTSVLCIKCKKGLDDVSNIRSVLLAVREDATQRLECESFRILLPNLKGRRPDRSTPWLRACMRSILCAKMREDVVLHG